MKSFAAKLTAGPRSVLVGNPDDDGDERGQPQHVDQVSALGSPTDERQPSPAERECPEGEREEQEKAVAALPPEPEKEESCDEACGGERAPNELIHVVTVNPRRVRTTASPSKATRARSSPKTDRRREAARDRR